MLLIRFLLANFFPFLITYILYGGKRNCSKQNKILAYGGLATPLAMIGYPIAIWLIPFYSEVTKFELALLADLLLLARFTDVITDPTSGSIRRFNQNKNRKANNHGIALGVPLMMYAIYRLFMPGDDVTVSYFLIWIMLMYLGSTAIGIPLWSMGGRDIP
ncbi:MAG: hypothetical protein Ct9H90mP4_14280 [Gammaproteobacteria bacterium]|nr:MAG: hypothetical protein Ct9H90mP4_14280 [Gammaproteobacteria bacterium]